MSPLKTSSQFLKEFSVSRAPASLTSTENVHFRAQSGQAGRDQAGRDQGLTEASEGGTLIRTKVR